MTIYTDPMTHTIKTLKYEQTPDTPYPLGRHVRHDSRSLQYRFTAPSGLDPATLTSVRHTRHIPVLDQGQVGSCTGNAATGALGTEPLIATVPTDPSTNTALTLDEAFALSVYSDAEVIDGDGPYPPNDNGSSGLSIAQVLKARNLISGYTHATSLNDTLAALSVQPVIIGIPWHNDMFAPAADGKLSITGNVVGGHEIVLDELDTVNKRVWMTNSWGEGWGVQGRAYLTWDDLGTLLADNGDCTVFVPLTQPAPTPTPAPAPEPDAHAVMMGKIRRAIREYENHKEA